MLHLSGAARYVGKSRLGVGPVLGQTQGDYVDTSLAASLRRGAVQYSLSLTNLLDSNGTPLFTETRNTPADTIPDVVGGNRYGWFTVIDVDGGIEVDNHELFAADPENADDCKNGGWDGFGFRNQGQCIKFVNTGKDSR